MLLQRGFAHRYATSPIRRQSALGKLPEWTMFSQMSSMFLVALCLCRTRVRQRAAMGGRRVGIREGARDGW